MFNAVSGLTPEVDIMKYCIGVPVQLKAKHLRCISKTGIKLEALLRAQLWVADFKSFYPMMLSIRRKLGNIRSPECRASICFDQKSASKVPGQANATADVGETAINFMKLKLSFVVTGRFRLKITVIETCPAIVRESSRDR